MLETACLMCTRRAAPGPALSPWRVHQLFSHAVPGLWCILFWIIVQSVLSAHISSAVGKTFPPLSHEACENEETLQLLDSSARPTKHTIISAADPNELNVHSQASKL